MKLKFSLSYIALGTTLTCLPLIPLHAQNFVQSRVGVNTPFQASYKMPETGYYDLSNENPNIYIPPNTYDKYWTGLSQSEWEEASSSERAKALQLLSRQALYGYKSSPKRLSRDPTANSSRTTTLLKTSPKHFRPTPTATDRQRREHPSRSSRER